MRRAFLWSGLLLLHTQLLAAQHIQRPFESWNDRVAPALTPGGTGAPLRTAVEVPRRDYRYEGLFLGGLTLGAAGAWIGSQITEACPTEPGIECGSDRLGTALAVGLVGAAVGGGLGYLVGRLSAKPPAPADSTQP